MSNSLQKDFQELQEHIGHAAVMLSNAIEVSFISPCEIEKLQKHLGDMSTLLSKAVNSIIELQSPINHFDQCADCGEDINYSNRYCQRCAVDGVYGL